MPAGGRASRAVGGRAATLKGRAAFGEGVWLVQSAGCSWAASEEQAAAARGTHCTALVALRASCAAGGGGGVVAGLL